VVHHPSTSTSNNHGTRVEEAEVNFVGGAYTGNKPHQIKKKNKT